MELTTAQLVGIIVGSVVGFLLLLAIAIFYWFYFRTPQPDEKQPLLATAEKRLSLRGRDRNNHKDRDEAYTKFVGTDTSIDTTTLPTPTKTTTEPTVHTQLQLQPQLDTSGVLFTTTPNSQPPLDDLSIASPPTSHNSRLKQPTAPESNEHQDADDMTAVFAATTAGSDVDALVLPQIEIPSDRLDESEQNTIPEKDRSSIQSDMGDVFSMAANLNSDTLSSLVEGLRSFDLKSDIDKEESEELQGLDYHEEIESSGSKNTSRSSSREGSGGSGSRSRSSSQSRESGSFSRSDREDTDSEQSRSSSEEGIVADYYSLSDINLSERAKKTSYSAGGSEPVFLNEDAYVCTPHLENDHDVAFFGVFDGHGGDRCSKNVKNEFPEIFYNWFLRKNGYSKKDLTDVWVNAYQEMENTLNETSEYNFMGSTSTTAVIWTWNNRNRMLQLANLGDSTAYLLQRQGPNEICVQLTEDHKLSNNSERTRIGEMGVELNQFQTRIAGGLAVTRAFADFECKVRHVSGLTGSPQVYQAIPLDNTTKRLILATDGLWDVMSGEEAFSHISGCDRAKEAARVLIDLAVQSRKCCDNVTVIVIFF